MASTDAELDLDAELDRELAALDATDLRTSIDRLLLGQGGGFQGLHGELHVLNSVLMIGESWPCLPRAPSCDMRAHTTASRTHEQPAARLCMQLTAYACVLLRALQRGMGRGAPRRA